MTFIFSKEKERETETDTVRDFVALSVVFMLHIFSCYSCRWHFLLLIKQDECRSVRKMERKMNGKQGVKLVYRKEEKQHSISEVTHSHTSLL